MTSKKLTVKRIQELYTQIAKLITSSLELSKIADAIMKEIELFFEPRNWSLFRFDLTTQELFFFVAKGINQKTIKHIRLKLGEGIAGYVAKTGKSVYVKNAEHDPRFSKKVDTASGFQTRSLIAVPIIFQKQVLGVIELVNTHEGRRFTQYELHILETIAEFSAIALTNAMMYEHTLSLSVRDPLTGVYNRARLNALLHQCTHAREAKRTKQVLKKQVLESHVITAWIDIDSFKQINDRSGHRAGDEVLIKTAHYLQNQCRTDDFVFRVGGDEFVIVMTNLAKKNVAPTLLRLQKSLKAGTKAFLPEFSFSFGITSGKKADLKKLIEKADQLMYDSKGRKHKKENKLALHVNYRA